MKWPQREAAVSDQPIVHLSITEPKMSPKRDWENLHVWFISPVKITTIYKCSNGIRRKAGESSAKKQHCITSKRMCSPSPRFLIPHKLSIVVYRNPSKWPHSSSHALKALSPFPRRRWTAIHQYGMSGGSRIVKSSLVKMGAACWLAVFSIMRFDSSPPSSCSVSQHMTERMLPLNLLESWRKPSVNGSYVKRWSRSRRNSITWAFRLHNAQIHSDVPAVFVNIHEEWWAGQRNQGWKIEKYEKPLTSLTPHRCTF